jgi:hypothetical protein
MKAIGLALAGLMLAAPGAYGQGAGAVELGGGHGKYPAVWPAELEKSTVPAWAKSANIRFARWDGGRIETAKAMLSGWEGLNPPDPDIAYTMTNWYGSDTVKLLVKAHINVVWITLSVGFSPEAEAAHQAEVRRYIAECHRNGIHVMAYESIANIFWEDMFARHPEAKGWVQLRKDGTPTPYGSADYNRMGRTTRYMADLNNPEWQKLVLQRVDLAIESGADGIIYDNNSSDALIPMYEKIRDHAMERRHEFLIMANFHHDTYALNRLLNCITTEDGREPGLWGEDAKNFAAIKEQLPYAQKLGARYVVNNFGLLSMHEALSEGWKPTTVEDGTRANLTRYETFMPVAHQKLALAENMAFGVPLELYVEGRPANELYTQEPGAVAVWDAVAQYNGFFAQHQELYEGAHSVAPLAIVVDDRSEGVPVLNGLAARGVPFVVVYERDVTAEMLKRYQAVALLGAQTVHESSILALADYVRDGGYLLATRDSGTLNENGAKRSRSAYFLDPEMKGTAAFLDLSIGMDAMAKALLSASGHGPVTVQAPTGVLFHVTEQRGGERRMVHLLNYTGEPAHGVTVQVDGRYASVRLLSPDGDTSLTTHYNAKAKITTAEVGTLDTFSVLVLEQTDAVHASTTGKQAGGAAKQ